MLATEFEIKDLGEFDMLLDMEVARSKFQRWYYDLSDIHSRHIKRDREKNTFLEKTEFKS